MLPLCGEASVFGHGGPAIRHNFQGVFAGVDHWFNGKNHSRLHFRTFSHLPNVCDKRLFVETSSHAVTTEFSNDRAACRANILLNGVADVAEMSTGLNHANAFPHRIECDLAKARCGDRYRFYFEHSARVAMESVLDYGDVDIENVAFFKNFFGQEFRGKSDD